MIDRITRQISIWMVAGIALGALCGHFLPQVSLALSFIGQLFLGGLKLLVIPLIITGTIAGISAFGDMRRAGRFSGQVLLYFLGSLIVAAIVGVTLVLIISPGSAYGGTPSPVIIGGWNSVSEALGSLIPGNLVQAISEGKYLGVVLLALFLGGMLTAMGVKGRSAVTLFKNIHEGLLRVLALLLLVAPLGLFSLIGAAVADGRAIGAASSAIAGSYLLTIVLALFVHGFLLLPLAVWFMGGRSPFVFFRNMMPAFSTAFGTSSSLATFPVTYRCLSEKCQIDERSTSMVLPLGSVINLPGTVICMIVATLFAAQMSGVAFGPLEVIGVVALAVLLSIGAAGIPSATLLAAPVLFGVIGLDPRQIALATGVVVTLDWLVDRLRAMVNVGGDAAGAAVLAESFELKTARRTAGRERSSTRGTRPGRTGSRERRPSDSAPRSTGRRTERTQRTEKTARSTEPTRGRGRKPAGESTDSPSRSRSGRTRSPRQTRTPFEMKAPSTPPLGSESGSTPSKRPAAEPKTESGTPRAQADRRRSPRSSEAVSGERRPRTRTRTPADRQPESKAHAQQASPSKPAPRRRSEPSRPAPVEPKPTPPVVEEPKLTPTEPVTRDNGVPAETNGELGRLSPSTVARELAKVSAQLRDPEANGSADAAPATPETTPDEPNRLIKEEPIAAAKPESPPESAIVDEPAAPEPAPAKAESAPSFGRTRRYKGAALRKEKDSPVPKTDKSRAPKEEDKAEGTVPKPPVIEAAPVEEPAPVAEPAPTPEPIEVVEPTEPIAKVPKAEEAAASEEKPEPTEPEPKAPPTFGRVKKKRIRK